MMAEAMGVSTSELAKMMEQGQVLTKDALPKFIEVMRRTARTGGALEAGMNNVTAAQNRLTNSWTKMISKMSDSGGKTGAVDFFDSLATLMEVLIPVAEGLGIRFRMLVNDIKTAVDYIEWAVRVMDGKGFALPGSDAWKQRKQSEKDALAKSVTGMSTSPTNNSNVTYNIDFTSTKADPSGVMQEFQRLMQGQLRDVSVGST